MASPLHYLDDAETLAAERAAFLEAAFELVEQAQSIDLQVAQVVRQAGRHNAAFYRIFGSKEGLVLAVVEEAVRRAVVVVERRMQSAQTPRDAVRAWARALLGLAAGSSVTVPAIALDRFRLLRRFPHADATIADPLREVLRRVLPATRNPSPALLAEAAFELVLGRQASWIALGHRPTDREIRAYADLVARLVGLPD